MPKHARRCLHRIGLLAAVAGLALGAADGMAQTVQQKRPQQVQQKQGQPASQSAWTKLCGKAQATAEEQAQAPQDAEQAQASEDVNVCRTFEEVLNNKDGRVVASVGIRQREGEADLVVTLPLGVNLRGDPQARIDGGKSVKLEYLRCGPIGCTADGKVTTDFVTAMRSGKQIVIEARGPMGKPGSFVLPLTGFAAAYDGQPSDAEQYQETRQRLVALIRARRAAQIQKAIEMLDQQQSQQQPSQQPSPELAPQGQPKAQPEQ
jgi:invasion protein IalB